MKVATPQPQAAARQTASDLSVSRAAPKAQPAPQTAPQREVSPVLARSPSLLQSLTAAAPPTAHPTNEADAALIDDATPERTPSTSLPEPLAREPAAKPETAAELNEESSELAAEWAAAIAQPGQPLPDRPFLERQLGRSLGHIRVHSGPAAQSLLQRLGAQAATHHHHILLAHPTVDAETLTHEVIHVLQAEGAATIPTTPLTVLPAHHPSEREAETLSTQLLQGTRRPSRPLLQRFQGNHIALRRTGHVRERSPLSLTDPERQQDSETARTRRPPRETPLGLEELQQSPQAESAEEAIAETEVETPEVTPAETPDSPPEAEVSPPPLEPEIAPETTAEETAAETTEETAPEETAIATAETTTAQTEEAQLTVRLPATTVNRRAQTETLLAETEALWDDGTTTADEHTVSPCEGSATPAHHHPFARGPPIDVPATDDLPDLSDPEPTPVDQQALDRSRSAVQSQLDRVSPDTRASEPGDLDPELERERRRQLREVNDEVDAAYRADAPRSLAPHTVDRTGTADPNRAITDQAEFTSRATERLQAQQTQTQEDFGEGRLAPESDPTTGHDVNLDQLEKPQVSPAEMGAGMDLNRIATEDNIGELDLDTLVAVRSEEFEATELTLTAEGESQRLIDETIAESDRTLGERCRTAHQAQTQLLSAAESGVGERRAAWQRDLDQHVSQRTEEGQHLARDKLAHIDTVQRTADTEARTTVESAQTEADTQWQATRDRAEQKTEQSEDRSWWEQGADLFIEGIATLTNWLVNFVEDCKAAINTLLDRASEVAHGIVNAAHHAISGSLDLLRDGLDAIADNLPGELGEIAQGYRDDAFEFLDGVQADVDQWAADLHTDIDDTVEGLRTELNQALDGLAEGIRVVGGMVQDLFENGVMALLSRYFPNLANLIDRGLDWAIDWAAESLETWLDTLLEITGIENLEQTLVALYDERFCQEETPEEQAEACADFEQKLQDLLGWFELLLESPFAQRIQAFLEESRDETAEQQLDAAEGFFSFIREASTTVQEWWTSIRETVAEVVDFFGDIAGTIWRNIAIALGIDPNLDPIEALMAGLEALWDGILSIVQPIIDAVREAWRWIREDSFLAPIIDFFARLPELWNALTGWLSAVTSAIGTWLAEAAEALVNTILSAVQQVLDWASGVMHRAIDRLSTWFANLFAQIEALLAWQSLRESLNRLLAVLQRATLPLRIILRAFSDCLIAALRWGADVVGNLLHYARIFMDICVGLLQALVLFPVLGPLAFVPFLAGSAWLYLVPECYKGPILNFILDLIIRFIRFLPEPADFVYAAIYQGALSFFETLRDAPDPQKVGAINLIASIFAGNAEVAAGFAVGLVEGVWESTGGTIIFLLEVVVWLLTLPFRLANWAIGLLSGESGESSETGVAEEPQSRGEDAGEPEEPLSGEDTEDVTDAEAEPEAESDDLPGAAEPENDPEADVADAEGETVAEAGSGGGTEGDRPPDAPAELSQLSETFQQLISEGFNREDLRQFIDSMRQTLAGMVGQLAEEAATNLLNALNSDGTAFQIGRVMGTVVGIIAVEVLLAIFTGGGSTAITAAKTAIQGSRIAGRLVSAFRRIRRAIEPLLDMVQRLRGALRNLINRIRRWFDDILEWIRNIFRRVSRRGGRGAGRRGAGRGAGRRGAGRRGAGRRGGRGPRRAGERGILEGIAEGLARAGWALLWPIARSRVVRKHELDRALSRVPRPAGYRVRLAVEHLAFRDDWTVEAKVRRRIRPVGVATHGRGWRLRHRLTTWYTTAGDQDSKHRRVVRDADRRIEREAADIERQTSDADEISRRLRPVIDRIEDQPNPRLLDGLTFDINERRPHLRLRGRRRWLEYHYSIRPNTSDGEIEIGLANIRETRPRFGSTTSRNFGQSMVVHPLTRHPLDFLGEPAERAPDNDTWDILKQRRDGGRTYYVRGHLLNYNQSKGLHGPAEWRNLSPITQTANGHHHNAVENRLKNLLWDGGTHDEPALFYRVVADYQRRGPNNRLLRAINDDTESSTEESTLRRQIVNAEQYIPSRFVCTAYELDPHDLSRTRTLFNNREIDNRISEGRPSDIQVNANRIQRQLRFLNLRHPTPASQPGNMRLGLEAYRQLYRVGRDTAEKLWQHRETFDSWDAVRQVEGIGETMTYLWQTAAGFTVRPNEGRTQWEPEYE